MPSKSEKQRKFFGAVMGAKKGKGKVKGAAKKAAKEMPKKEIKKFLKKESYDSIVNSYLKKYLLEMDTREGFPLDDPFIDPTEDMSDGVELSPEEKREIVAREVGEEQISMMSDQEIEQYYNDVVQLSPEEDIEYQEMYIVVSQAMGEEKASKLSPEKIKQAYYEIENNPSMGMEEDEESEQGDREFIAWLKNKFKDRPEFLKNLRYDQDMVTDLLYDFRREKAQGNSSEDDEDYEEEDCESAHQGCTCDGCSQCMANREKASGGGDDQMLNFYYPKKAI
jgi:hypothetical protein